MRSAVAFCFGREGPLMSFSLPDDGDGAVHNLTTYRCRATRHINLPRTSSSSGRDYLARLASRNGNGPEHDS